MISDLGYVMLCSETTVSNPPVLYCLKRCIFQTFRKTDFGARLFFIELLLQILAACLFFHFSFILHILQFEFWVNYKNKK